MINVYTPLASLKKSLRLSVVFLSAAFAITPPESAFAQALKASMPSSLVEIMPRACRTSSQEAIQPLTDGELSQIQQWLASNERVGISWPSVISTNPLAIATFKEIVSVDGVKLGVWRAGMGSYSHPGGDDGEVFITLGGAGTLIMDGKTAPILPGSISVIPPNTPSVLEIAADAEKIVIFCDR